ncbi:kynureninase-like isoform X4 [Dermacentor andersoni]|uniref:kynureninase-like isoform X4 n=1 Tax=Dermacentor andersoni TaxID=34620 RepID=UPI002415A6F8|nr:kynureninase-like isoform X4 [Dermacentor andersoni]
MADCVGSMKNTPRQELLSLAKQWGLKPNTIEFARRLDCEDPLRAFRERFNIPKMADVSVGTDREYLAAASRACWMAHCWSASIDPQFIKVPGQECIYLCGHSLGLKPKAADGHVQKVLDNWGKTGAECHVHGYLPAATCDLYPRKLMADIVGADPDEIVFMNGLTVNLHLLMMTYYRPQGKRCKMVIESYAFPSDMYAAQSQVAHHGLDVASNLLILKPRQGEQLLREEDIYDLIETEGDSIALLLLPGVQYYTGQVFDVPGITKAARKKGAIILWDMAHAVCNMALKLNEWDVDIAAWCTYKYMNSGPGSIGVAYISHKFRKACERLPELRGWWGNNIETKFLMRPEFDPCLSADVFKLSNGPPLLIATVMASLECDLRMPSVVRLAPMPMYNTYEDVYNCIQALREICANFPLKKTS